jgi:uncharacterized membrane protein (DUF485 family)
MVRFFALKSAKWSMADVMVIAIFMTYVGFNGMISSQLELLTRRAASAGVDVCRRRATAPRCGVGSLMFLAFCLFSLATSTMMASSHDEHRRGRPHP